MSKVNGEFVNDFSWSVSQDKRFSECKRNYYYYRYGTWNGWKPSAGEEAKELYALKQLKMKNQWVGIIVHDIIGVVLRSIREGKILPQQKAEEILEEKMRVDFIESRENAFRKDPKRITRFFEHEYGLDFSGSEAQALVAFAKKCLSSFYENGIYAQLKTVRKEDWLTIDESAPSELNFEGTKVYVKLDAAVRQGGKVLVFDWKTSRQEDVDYSVQMGCYLLYAVRAWNAKPQDVDVFEVNLALNQVKKHAALSSKISWVESHMRNSITAIKSILKDPEKNIAAEEDFPKINVERYCRNCEFLRVCKPGVLPDGKPPAKAHYEPEPL